MARRVLRSHYPLETRDGPAKASMAVRAFQISSASMHAPVDDQWAFLELIDAPQWVDLSLEEALLGLEGDDAWFYESHPYHEAPFQELDSFLGLQVRKSTSKIIGGQVENEIVSFKKGEQQHPVSSVHLKHKKAGSVATDDELYQMTKSQPWPRSKAKRIQLQPHHQVQDDCNKSPAPYESSTFASRLTASRREVVSARAAGSDDLISLLMQRVRISDSLATASELKEFDKVGLLSPRNKDKQSVERSNQFQHSNPISSTLSSSPHHNISQVNSKIDKMEMRPWRQKQSSKIQSSCDAATFIRSLKDTGESLISSKSIMHENAKPGRKHDHGGSLKMQAGLNSPYMLEAIVSSADKINKSFAFQGDEEKSNRGVLEENDSNMGDISMSGPLDRKALYRVKESQSASLGLTLPTIEFSNGTKSLKVDLVRSRDREPRCMRGHLQTKVAGSGRLHQICTDKAETKTGHFPKLLDHNRKQSSSELTRSGSHVLTSKKDSKTIPKLKNAPVMYEVKSRMYGAAEGDLAALIAEHNKKVQVMPKYKPRCHSVKEIKERETATDHQHYTLQPAKREKSTKG